MTWIIVVIGVVLILVLFLKLKKKEGTGPTDEVWPFYAKKPLSQPEQILYFRLVHALPDSIVLAQVQLSRMMGVKKGSDFNSWNNRINRLSVDFLVCNKDASIVAAIELDDSTHARTDRMNTDVKKDKALASAGIRIIRWQVKALPDEAAIKAALQSATAIFPPTMPTGETGGRQSASRTNWENKTGF